MTTARDIIQSALFELGEYSPGEPVDAADADLGFKVINDMLDGWSNENLMCHARAVETFATVGNQASYTIGDGGDIDTTRPLKVEQAWLTDAGGSRRELYLPDRPRDFNLLDSIDSGEPTVFYYDPQSPLGVIWLWVKPNAAYTVSFMSYLQFTRFATLSSVVLLPPGYVGALKKNLAVELAPFFNRNPLPITVELASQYKGKVKSKNIRVPASRFDAAITGARGRGNIFTGDY